MKLTREQISNLSDTELNRAMVWYYGYPDYGDPENLVGVISWGGSYLEDWAATMPLAVEQELEIEFMKKTRVTECYDGAFSSHENPLRAIAEVLVMIAMEAKQ